MSFLYCNLNDVKFWLAGLDISDMPENLDELIEQAYIPLAKREIDGFIGENLDLTTTNEFYDGSGSNTLILRHRPVSFVRNVVLRIIPQIEWFQFKRQFHLNHIDSTGVQIAERGGVEPIDDQVVPPLTFPQSAPVPDDLKVDTGNTGNFINTTEQYEKADLYVDCKLGLLAIPPRILFLENQAVPFWNYTWLLGTQNIEVEYDYGYKNLDNLPQEFRSACAQLVAAKVLHTKGLFSGAGSVSLNVEGLSKSFGDVHYGGHIKAFIAGAMAALTPFKRIRAI